MHVNPNVMNDHLKGQKIQAPEVPDFITDEELQGLMEEDEQVYSEPERPRFKAKSEDETLYPGGPHDSQVLSWKKQFGEVYLTDIGVDTFIWRPLNRFEYKQIVAVPNTDPLMREEMICETCVLWPEEFTFDKMAKDKAGVPAVLAEQIMEKSGFTRSSQPRLL